MAPAPAAKTGTVSGSGDAQVPANGVAAIVNDSIISNYDLDQRIKLFAATAGVKPPPEQMKEIRGQVLKQLETEKLEILEAQRKNISVSTAEVDKAITSIISDNHLTEDKLKEMLSGSGVAMATLRSQIATEIAWSKAVQDEFTDQIKVAPADVDDEMKRIAEGANKPHFLIAEIFLSVDTPEQDAKVLKDAQDLEAQLRAGAPFNTVARQFSQNPSAAQGGDLGWVHEGQLSPDLANALKGLTPGQVTPPVRSTGGYYILAVRDRQEGVGAKMPDPAATAAPAPPPGTLTIARILLPIGPKPAPALFQNAMKAGTMIAQHLSSCEQAAKISQAVKGAVYFNLGTMKLREMSAQMQSELAKTQPGGVTEPFQSPAGIELIVRCDKAPPRPLSAFKLPSRDQVEQQLFQQQVAAFSRRYLRDLRRTADIEDRQALNSSEPAKTLN